MHMHLPIVVIFIVFTIVSGVSPRGTTIVVTPTTTAINPIWLITIVIVAVVVRETYLWPPSGILIKSSIKSFLTKSSAPIRSAPLPTLLLGAIGIVDSSLLSGPGGGGDSRSTLITTGNSFGAWLVESCLSVEVLRIDRFWRRGNIFRRGDNVGRLTLNFMCLFMILDCWVTNGDGLRHQEAINLSVVDCQLIWSQPLILPNMSLPLYYLATYSHKETMGHLPGPRTSSNNFGLPTFSRHGRIKSVPLIVLNVSWG